MYKNFEERLLSILSPEQIKRKEPLAKHTTFRIGGPADYFLSPGDGEQVGKILQLCKELKIPYYIMGNGSNILAGDQGFSGVIIHVGKEMDTFSYELQEDGSARICAGAGILLSKLSKKAAELSMTGLEFAGGIPGTLGGAVTMNAGAYGGEMKDCITCAKVMDSEGRIRTLQAEELELGYRSSIIQKEQWIVLEAEFLVKPGQREKILATMEDFQQRRKDKQPLEYPSAGSTFKRPEGYFAGKLIEDAGLKGYRVGDVMVSDKHCGFVVNVGQGTARDAHCVIEDVTRIVYEKFQVHLEPEVRFLGQ